MDTTTTASDACAHLRSDAQANYNRILAAATTVIEREGPDAPLTTIAAEASVGIGTLYRRFPTRAHLVEAVYRHRIITLCDTTAAILESESSPHAALQVWMSMYVDMLITNKAVPDAIKPLLATDTDFRTETRNNLVSALAEFIAEGRRTETVRQDVDPVDILRALTGVAFVSESSDHARASIALIADGLRPQPPRPQ
ncbi:TetR/AcrR family transcriptional regulator [Gordonia neofelifaecis]|uniref:TetR family transcriptional regulator n=1 Tax=Gordonia neofelifaecis NRRL B-59395 TaxID=644548 RepID=F1YKX4_9ACTN|nr:TetR/AcrR family transcriptional regulator [Gordonia neofelifaecis]EGD54768.1 TetR family transcriptional regulator [Gordonia neofelifaecis NRRL B-59395]